MIENKIIFTGPVGVGNSTFKWYVDVTAHKLLRIDRPMMALYVDGHLTTRKVTIKVT